MNTLSFWDELYFMERKLIFTGFAIINEFITPENAVLITYSFN